MIPEKAAFTGMDAEHREGGRGIGEGQEAAGRNAGELGKHAETEIGKQKLV